MRADGKIFHFIASSLDAESRPLKSFWLAELKRRGAAFTWHDCGGADEIVRRARQGEGPRVAVGGDGTVNAVINGLMMSGGQGPLGVLPTGAVSDFCLSHSIPTEKSEALNSILNARTRPLDMAETCLTGAQAEQAASYFAAGTSLTVGGTRGLAFWKHKPFISYLTLDDEKFEFSRTDLVIIFQNPILAQALKLHPAVGERDARVTLLLFHNNSKNQLAKLLCLFTARKPLPKANTFARPFTRATITNGDKLPVEYEGEAIGFTPMEVKLKSNVLDLIVPPPGR